METKKRKNDVAKERIERIMYSNIREEFLKNYKSEQATRKSQDTVLRYELQSKINAYISEGRTHQEIVDILLSTEQYSKYAQYIPNWVTDRMNKKDVIRKNPFNRSMGD